MMRPFRLVAVAATVIALSATPSPAQDAALLLGHYGRTTLIVVHGDSGTARRGIGLVVPRATGWWRVGVDSPTVDYPEFHSRLYPKWRADSIREDSLRYVTREPVADTEPERKAESGTPEASACFGRVFWTAPLGAWPTLADSECDAADRQGDVTLSFVSPLLLTAFVGITTDNPDDFARDLVVLRLDSLAHHPFSGMGLGSDALDDEHDPRWLREAARCNRWYNRDFMDDPNDPEPRDHIGTLIQRGPGRWRYARYYANLSHAGQGQETTCDLTIPVPVSLTGWDRLTVPLAALRKRDAKLIDAFTSPGSATGAGVAVVIDSAGMRVFRVTQGKLGAELASVANDPSWVPDLGALVMAQWATGASVGRWEKELAVTLPEVVSVTPSSASSRR